MADFKYERKQFNFTSLGMDLNRPVDRLKPQKDALLQNVRSSHKFGCLMPRPGLTATGLAGSHSIRRLNDPRTLRGVRVTGHSTSLYVDGVSKDTGYSGNPLALVPHRPAQSPEAWMYIADSSRMRKVNVDGTVHQIGMAAPLTPPTVTLAPNSSTSTYYKELDDGDATTNWSADGVTATAIAASNPVRLNTTVTGVLYDSGSSGWCSVHPNVIENINEGAYLTVETGQGDVEQVMVQSVHVGTTATTIADIRFDSGTDGACSLVLTTPYPNVGPNTLLRNTTEAGTYGRVTSIAEGSDGLTSLRVITATGSTWVATDNIISVPSFRTYAVALEATDTLTATGINIAFAGTAGTGYAQKDVTGAALDFTTIASGVPATPDDYIHLSIRISDPTLVTQCRLMVDLGTDLAAPFTENYLYKTFRPDDLTPVAFGDVSELSGNQRALSRTTLSGQPKATPEGYYLIGTLPPSAEQLNLGATWQELRFKLSEFIRVGNDPSVTRKLIYFIRLEFTVTAGALNADIHSFGILGGHGPDSGQGVEGDSYLYRYRARCSTTGTVSNWSPASRNPIYARRQQINVVAPAQYTAASEADLLEIQRFGGTIRDWHIVGIVDNDASPNTLNDDMPDDVALTQSTEGQVNYQPWPIIGVPASGTATFVCGTTVLSSAAFNLSWAPGTRIEINDQVYTIYRVVSTSRIELFQSAGVATSAAFRLPEPVLISQPLYAFWGPLNGTMFACGDPNNPQRLYFLNRNSEGTTDTNYIDITSPSEPIQNGVIYNGRSYAWSTERLFEILPTGGTWDYSEVPGAKGLWAKWCFTGFQGATGPTLCYLADDGIESTNGGASVSLTEADLNPLFPNEGNMGITTNDVLRPYMDSAYGAQFRLAYHQNHLYFDYNVVS